MTATIQGRVLDKESNAGLPNVEVQAASPLLHREAITDANGRYAIKNVPDGQYVLVAIKSRCGDTKHVSIRNGSSLDIDLKLPTPSSMSGRVFSGDNTAAANVTVSLWRIGTFDGLPTLLYQGESKTDGEGSYKISGLPKGQYYLIASRERPVPRKRRTVSKKSSQPKLQESIRQDVATYYPGSFTGDGATSISVKESSEVSNIDLKLLRASTYCVDATLTASGRTAISVFQSFPEGNVIVDKGSIVGGGPIEVCDLAPGPYFLNASLLPDPGKPFTRIAEEDFSIDHENVDIGRLDPLPTVSIHGHVEIIGNKVDTFPNGIIIEAIPYKRTRYLEEDTRSKVTPSGEFSFPRAFVRPYVLQVRNLPKGYYLKSAMVGSEDVTVAPFKPDGNELDITLANDAADVTGSVMDENHHPLADFLILLTSNPLPVQTERGQILIAHSDQNGEFSFASVPPGKHLLFAIPDDGNVEQSIDFLRTDGGTPEEIETKADESKSVKLVTGPKTPGGA